MLAFRLALTIAPALALIPGAALAQRSAESAMGSAEDAFGTNVGLESTGIYSEFDTRGFSPTKAGNVRIDGIYMDTIGVLAGRLRDRTAIRVGFAAEAYPFQAPTGIVDHKFRSAPQQFGNSVAWHQQAYGGFIAEWDFRLPVTGDRFSLTGGLALSHSKFADGSVSRGNGVTLRPIVRIPGFAEIAPFFSKGGFFLQRSHPLVVVRDENLPAMAPLRRYLGQSWAKGRTDNINAGVTVKARISDSLSFRGGLFHAEGNRRRNFTDIYSVVSPDSLVSHRLIADPKQDVHSTSGEAQVALRLVKGRWQHRFLAGYRSRNRYTETGGSAIANAPALAAYGELNPIAEQAFAYSRVNQGRVGQSALMLGYIGKLDGLGTLNLGIQKARFRGSSIDGRSGAVTTSRDDPWLYNAMLGIALTPSLSVYAGTQKGLEDSGAAPENALNRNEQLPPARSVQYEGGVRWKFPGGQLVVNAFQIDKPYFSFDTAGNFARQGNVRHRGIETSLSGHFGKRLNVVAGAVLMQPRLSIGGRPAGTPSTFGRIDVTYRTDILGGLTPTADVTYTGARPVNPQLTLPAHATVDLGLRQSFKLGSVAASIRGVVQNVLDDKSWKVVAANTLYQDERRRFTLSLAADF